MKLHFDKIYSVERPAEPAYIAIPLPKGKLIDHTKIALVQDKKLLPFQSKATALHDDGSIKFLFVRFQADLPANKPVDIDLYIDEPVSFDQAIIPVANSLLYELAYDSDHIFSNIKTKNTTWDGQTIKGPFLTTTDGTSYSPSFGKWGILESGDICKVYSCVGHLVGTNDCLELETRITSYNTKPWLDLSFRLTNTTDNPLDIRSYSLNIYNFDNETPRTMVASSNYKTDFLISETGETVEKEITATSLLNQGNEHFAEVLYGTFFADITNSQGGITATVYQAFQNFPKAVKASKDGLEVMLVPSNHDLPVIMQPGMAIEQNIQLYFHKPDEDIQSINSRSLIYQMPDKPHLSPDVYKECGFLPDIFTNNKDWNAEEALINCADAHARSYGMLNWGDAPDPNYTSQGRGQGSLIWTNNEYDFPYACMLMYYRTGTRRFLDYALVAGRHQINVDVCHYSKDPLILGGQWEHTKGHCQNGEIVCSHQWVEGILACYHATGDERFYETAIGIGDNILRLLDTPTYQKNGALSARETGWALRTLTALFVETRDLKWLTKSKWIVGQFKEWFDRYNGWLAPYTDNIVLRVPFMISIAIGSLMRYYRVSPQNDICIMIINAVDDLIENCQLESGLFFYKEMPSLNRLGNNPLILEALAIAYELTGDKKYLDAGKRTYEKTIKAMSSAGGGGKRIAENAVITGTTGTKQFAQTFIPFTTYYTAISNT